MSTSPPTFIAKLTYRGGLLPVPVPVPEPVPLPLPVPVPVPLEFVLPFVPVPLFVPLLLLPFRFFDFLPDVVPD